MKNTSNINPKLLFVNQTPQELTPCKIHYIHCCTLKPFLSNKYNSIEKKTLVKQQEIIKTDQANAKVAKVLNNTFSKFDITIKQVWFATMYGELRLKLLLDIRKTSYLAHSTEKWKIIIFKKRISYTHPKAIPPKKISYTYPKFSPLRT